MAGFIYVGFEPTTSEGNDTAATAGGAQGLGPFIVDDVVVVRDEVVFTGTVESEGGSGGEGPDPADFVRIPVSNAVNRVAIGFEIDFGNTLVDRLVDGVIGLSFELRVALTGAVTDAADVLVRAGALAVGDDRFEAVGPLFALENARFSAFNALVSADDWTSNVDTPVYEALEDAVTRLRTINAEVGQGDWPDGVEAFLADRSAEIAGIKASISGVPPAHPTLESLKSSAIAFTDAFTPILDGFLDVEVFVDGAQIDVETSELFDLSNFDLERVVERDVDGETLLVEIQGSVSEARDGFLDIRPGPIDYGFGVGLVSFENPGVDPDPVPGPGGGSETPIQTGGGGGTPPDPRATGTDGDDRLDGDGGDDTIDAGAGGDVVKSAGGADSVDLGDGDDIALSGTGDDTVIGGDGADTIKSGTGDDFIDCGADDDIILAGDDNDTILGGTGDDTIKSGRGDDSMDGGAGDDVLVGFRGDEILIGGEGNDTLLGNLDDDTLIGGAGDDRLQGGPGRDTFVFDTPEWGDDRIVLDFRPQSDTLDFSGSGLTRADLTISQRGGNVLIEAGDSSILINSQRFGALDVADFDDGVLIF